MINNEYRLHPIRFEEKSCHSTLSSFIDQRITVRLCRPSAISKVEVAFTRVQEHVCKWPVNFGTYGFQQEEIDQLHLFLFNIMKVLKPSEYSLIYKIKRGTPITIDSKTWVLPRSITLFPFYQRVCVSLRRYKGDDTFILGRGGERLVKATWEAFSGQLLTNKNIGWHEFPVYEECMKGEVRGFPEVHLLCEKKQPKRSETIGVVYEKVYEGTLKNYLAYRPTFTLHNHLFVFLDLISCLEKLHMIPLPNGKGSFCHGDIKGGNILVFWDTIESRIKAVLNDFGFATPWRGLGSCGWRSPEYLWFKRNSHLLDLSSFKIEYAPKKDIWNMGLLLALLLQCDDTEKSRFPFACIEKRVEIVGKIQNDQAVEYLSQQEIDEEIAVFQEKCKEKERPDLWVRLWNLVKSMLQVLPVNRPIAKTVREEIEACLRTVQK